MRHSDPDALSPTDEDYSVDLWPVLVAELAADSPDPGRIAALRRAMLAEQAIRNWVEILERRGPNAALSACGWLTAIDARIKAAASPPAPAPTATPPRKPAPPPPKSPEPEPEH